MPKRTSSEKLAYFCNDDPRFAMVAGVRLPVLFSEKIRDGRYTERLGSFDGLRDEFAKLADRVQSVVLVSERGDEWTMIGEYAVSGVQSYGEPFECLLGRRTAKLTEIPSPEAKPVSTSSD